MAENTKIEWCDATFNPWIGCTKVSVGAKGACVNCYAEVATPVRAMHIMWGPGKPRYRTGPSTWAQPMRWERNAEAFLAANGRRQRVFCASLADVFDNEVDPQWRTDLFRLIQQTPHLDWLLLTKRIGNARQMLNDTMSALHHSSWDEWPWTHVWLGATVVTQEEAERDIPKLLAMPARIRFLSIEPMLESIDLRSLCYESGDQLPDAMRVNDGSCSMDALRGVTYWPGSHYVSPTIKRDHQFIDGQVFQSSGEYRRIDWVIAGGESSSRARPSHPDWFRSLRDQCAGAGVSYFHKQNGEWAEVDAEQPTRTVVRENDDDLLFDREAARCHGFISHDGHFVRSMDDAREDTRYRGMVRIGKKAAGRLLDGREHNDSPGAVR